MELTVRELYVAFPGVLEVYDSLENFKRKWELAPAFKEIKEAATMFERERDNISRKEENDHKRISEVTKLLEEKIKIKGMRFTKDEVEKSKVKGSLMVDMMQFIES